MRSILSKFVAVLLLLTWCAAAKPQVNPVSQIRWPVASGAINPATPAQACTSVNYGQPYTNVVTGGLFVCTTAGWASVGPAAAPFLSASKIVVNTSATASRNAVLTDLTSFWTATGANCGTATNVLQVNGNCTPSSGGGVPGGSSQDVQVNVGGAFGADPGVYTYNTSTHTLTADNQILLGYLNQTPTDYPLIGASWSADNKTCTQKIIPGDTGTLLGLSGCMAYTYFDNYPGWDYGSPGQVADNGWYLPNMLGLTYKSNSAGIHSALSMVGFITGPGDVNFLAETAVLRQGWKAGSDEGFHGWRQDVKEMNEASATIVTGGTGAQVLTLTSVNNLGNMGLSSPLIDTTTGVACSISSIVVGTVVSGVAQATTSCTLPVSVQGSLAAAVSVPRAVPNTTLQLTQASVTVNINSTVDPTGKLISIVQGSNFYEVIKPTGAATNLGGNVWQITATFLYSHPASTPIFIGGVAGRYYEMTNYEPAGQKYLEYAVGSTGVNTILLAHQFPPSPGLQSFARAGPGMLYKGGDVIGVVDPANGTVDDQYIVVAPNDAPFAPDTVVLNTNEISAAYNYNDQLGVLNNPFASAIAHTYTHPGLVGGFRSDFNGYSFIANPVPITNYVSDGGLYYAPYLFSITGVWANGLAFNTPPVNNGLPISGLDPNCSGFLLCIANGPLPGSPTTEGLFAQGDQTAYLNYDHSNGFFNFVGGGITVNGSVASINGAGAFSGNSLLLTPHTVGGLPTVPTNSEVLVTDSLTNTTGACVGGGSFRMMAIFDGTAWSCH